MSRQFDDKNIDIMRTVQVYSPLSENFLSLPALLPLVEAYDLDKDAIDMETNLVKRYWKISDVFLVLFPLKDAFSELFRLIRILTTAVNTAHCKRSFSALKRIKTYTRSTMSERELSNSI